MQLYYCYAHAALRDASAVAYHPHSYSYSYVDNFMAAIDVGYCKMLYSYIHIAIASYF